MDLNVREPGPDRPDPSSTWEEADAAASSDPGPGSTGDDTSRPGVLGSTWRGARAGFRLTSLFVVGPIAGMMLPTGLAIIEFGVGTVDTPLTETRGARWVERLLAADAAIRAHDDDPDGAIEPCQAILGTGRSIGDEPFTASRLVRMGIGREAMERARRVLGQGEPSEVPLARLQELLLAERAEPLLLVGVRGERAAPIELFRRVSTGEVPISSVNASLVKVEPGGYLARIAP